MRAPHFHFTVMQAAFLYLLYLPLTSCIYAVFFPVFPCFLCISPALLPKYKPSALHMKYFSHNSICLLKYAIADHDLNPTVLQLIPT